MLEVLTNIDNLPFLIGGGFIIYLLNKLYDLKKELKERPIQYIDKSGVTSVNQMNFIDLAAMKTINYKVNNATIFIGHLSWVDCLRYIGAIANHYNALIEAAKSDDNSFIESAKYLNTLNNLIDLIIKLSSKFGKVKRADKKKFRVDAQKNVKLLVDICEQIIDFWNPVKKKILLLSRGKTLTSTLGGNFMWNSLNMDRDGKILIKPRFEKSSSLSTKETSR